MSKNRRKESAAVRFGPVLKVCLLCAFIGGAGVGYVWQKNQIYQLGNQMTQCERQLAELKRQNNLKANQLAQMQSPGVLELQVRKHKLGLDRPLPGQIVRLPEPPATAPEPRVDGAHQIVRNDPVRFD
ncbi:MAG: hypothetical protein HY301_04850 [Verrucomicrobia bacterium]|nr:hypothetical protein [Verrucomicrobiota bacterium]